jgi:hypothetical protein
MVFLFQSFTVQAGKVVDKKKIERKIEKEYTYKKIKEMTKEMEKKYGNPSNKEGYGSRRGTTPNPHDGRGECSSQCKPNTLDYHACLRRCGNK